MKQLILLSLAAACVVLLLAYFDVTKMLGAHPRWAVDVAVYGVVPGIVLAVVLSFVGRFALLAAVGDLIISGAIVWYGKRTFAESFGESVLGGQMWFFGWIAVCACTVAVIALGLRRLAN